jgi:hypothetical protein
MVRREGEHSMGKTGRVSIIFIHIRRCPCKRVRASMDGYASHARLACLASRRMQEEPPIAMLRLSHLQVLMPSEAITTLDVASEWRSAW